MIAWLIALLRWLGFPVRRWFPALKRHHHRRHRRLK
jgi:hypothetical protein